MDGKLQAYWPLPLRIVLGISFMVHGAPKVFSAEGNQQFQGMLQSLGVPLPALMSWVVGVVEFFGGIALILGLATSIVTALLSIDMIVAMLLVHAPHGFSFLQVKEMTPQGPVLGMPGIEVTLLFLSGLLALFIGGPGPVSVDERALPPDSHLRAPWLRHRAAHV
jgi:putative oxidoreductase